VKWNGSQQSALQPEDNLFKILTRFFIEAFHQAALVLFLVRLKVWKSKVLWKNLWKVWGKLDASQFLRGPRSYGIFANCELRIVNGPLNYFDKDPSRKIPLMGEILSCELIQHKYSVENY